MQRSMRSQDESGQSGRRVRSSRPDLLGNEQKKSAWPDASGQAETDTDGGEILPVELDRHLNFTRVIARIADLAELAAA
jgi:hypothetical protein